MRDIKFEFVYRRKADGFINKLLFNMNNNDELFGKAYLNDALLAEFDVIAKRQYTGLLDKNGVEIYEGDIVRADNRIFSVVYDRSNFAIKASHREKIVALLSVAQHNGCEVIGNIYENEDLLQS